MIVSQQHTPDLQNKVVVCDLLYLNVSHVFPQNGADGHTHVAIVTTASPMSEDRSTRPASCQQIPRRKLTMSGGPRNCHAEMRRGCLDLGLLVAIHPLGRTQERSSSRSREGRTSDCASKS